MYATITMNVINKEIEETRNSFNSLNEHFQETHNIFFELNAEIKMMKAQGTDTKAVDAIANKLEEHLTKTSHALIDLETQIRDLEIQKKLYNEGI